MQDSHSRRKMFTNYLLTNAGSVLSFSPDIFNIQRSPLRPERPVLVTRSFFTLLTEVFPGSAPTKTIGEEVLTTREKETAEAVKRKESHGS